MGRYRHDRYSAIEAVAREADGWQAEVKVRRGRLLYVARGKRIQHPRGGKRVSEGTGHLVLVVLSKHRNISQPYDLSQEGEKAKGPN